MNNSTLASPEDDQAIPSSTPTLAAVAHGNPTTPMQGSASGLSSRSKLLTSLVQDHGVPIWDAFDSVLRGEGCKKADAQAMALGIKKPALASAFGGKVRPSGATIKKMASFIGMDEATFASMLPVFKDDEYSEADLKHALKVLNSTFGKKK